MCCKFTMCQRTMCSLRAERSDREREGGEEGGKNNCLEVEKRHRPQTCVRPLSVTYHHPLISVALCVCVSVSTGAEHLTEEKFSLSVSPSEQWRSEPMHLIKHFRGGIHFHTHTWVLHPIPCHLGGCFNWH